MEATAISAREDDLLTDLLRRSAEAIPPDRQAEPVFTALRAALATALRHLGDTAAADREYEALIELQPDNATALMARIDLAIQANDLDAALRSADAALERLPDDRGAMVRRARILRRLGRLEEAVADGRKLLDRYPEDVSVAVELARALRDLDDPMGAETVYAAILALDPDNAEALLGRIDSALGQDMPEVALRRSEMAVARLPDHASILERHAVALQRAGRPRESVAVLETQLDRDPKSVPLRLRLALVLKGLGEYARADAIYDDVLAGDPDNEAALLGQIEVCQAAGDPDKALAACDTAIAKLGRSKRALRRRATILKQMGRQADAAEQLAELSDSHPDDLSLRLDLGRALLANGKTDEADRVFAGVLDKAPTNRDAVLGRVEAAEARGDMASALALLETHMGGAGRKP